MQNIVCCNAGCGQYQLVDCSPPLRFPGPAIYYNIRIDSNLPSSNLSCLTRTTTPNSIQVTGCLRQVDVMASMHLWDDQSVGSSPPCTVPDTLLLQYSLSCKPSVVFNTICKDMGLWDHGNTVANFPKPRVCKGSCSKHHYWMVCPCWCQLCYTIRHVESMCHYVPIACPTYSELLQSHPSTPP